MSEGSITIILGPMWAGKTTEMFRIIKRYKCAGKQCIVIKHKEDTRYSSEYASTHDEAKMSAVCAVELLPLMEVAKTFDVIAIDEGQFFADIVEFSENIANEGKTVIVASLDGTYMREPFGKILELIPKAENVVKISAICPCGKDASFTRRKTEFKGIKLIGGEESYIANCRRCYLRYKEDNENAEHNKIIKLFNRAHLTETIRESIRYTNLKYLNTDQSVCIALDRQTHSVVVIKSVRYKAEIEHLKLLRDHPNIIKILDEFSLLKKGKKNAIVINYASGGDLLSILNKQKKPFSEQSARYIFRQIAHALLYAHERGIAHGDIKPENIFLDANGTAYLGDWEYSFRYDVSGHTLVRRSCGTLVYAAPEIIDNSPCCGPEPDIWALGVTLFTMVTMDSPFNRDYMEDDSKIKESIKRMRYCIPEYISPELHDLFSTIFTPRLFRCDIADIFNHPWMSTIDELDFER